MNKIHWILLIVAVAVIGYIVYIKFYGQEKQPEREVKQTGKAPVMDMPQPPMDEVPEIVNIYADSMEDVMTYYDDPELEFGISQEEFDSLVQKEIDRREYKVKKIDRTRYMNEDKARRINDITRNQLETLTLNQMKKRSSVVDDFYEKRNYTEMREYDKTFGNRHQISMLEGQELSRPYAQAIEF
jgi:hypothetical protein